MLVVSSWSSLSLNLYRLEILSANPQHTHFCLISYTRNVWTYTSDPLVMAQYVRWLGGDHVHLVEHGARSQEALQLVGITHYLDLLLIS